MTYVDAWRRELELDSMQRHHAWGPWIFGWHCLQMFSFLLSARNDFYTPVPYGWEYQSNHSLGVPTQVLFSYLADHLRILESKVREHLGRITKTEIKLTTVGAILRTVGHAVVSFLEPDDMTLVCSEDGVLIRVSQGVVQKWFDMGIFRALRRMHRTPILSLLAIARLAEVE